MPVIVKEDWESEPLTYGDNGGGKGFRFNIYNANAEIVAWNALRDYSPAYYVGLIRNYIEVKPDNKPGKYFGLVRYASIGQAGTENPVGTTPPETQPSPASASEALPGGYSFDFSAEMTHKTQSIKTLARRAIGDALDVVGTAPDYKGAVGVEKSGANVRIQGYDSPTLSQTWTRTVPVEPMTLAYKSQIRSLIGKKNNAPFYDSAAGETVLWGASAQHVEGFRYTVTFTFHERENVTNLILRPDPADPTNPNASNALVVPHASGWDHIWVIYDEAMGDNELLKLPLYAYVEQIIKDGNFNLLGIGA